MWQQNKPEWHFFFGDDGNSATAPNNCEDSGRCARSWPNHIRSQVACSITVMDYHMLGWRQAVAAEFGNDRRVLSLRCGPLDARGRSRPGHRLQLHRLPPLWHAMGV